MLELDYAIGLNLLNVLLSLALLGIYFQNYRKMPSHFGIGLMLFAFLFFIQNAVAVYYQSMMVMYYTSEVAAAALVLTALQTLALGTFLWITVKPS